MKGIVAAVVAVALIGGGWLGWRSYDASQESNLARQAVQLAASQLERQLNARTEDGITFAEYFKRASSTLESMDESASKLSTEQWSYGTESRDLAVGFIEQSKAMVRYEQAYTKLLMDENGARSILDDAKAEAASADTSAAIQWTSKRFSRASDELIKVLEKLIENSKAGQLTTEKMIAADDAVKKDFGAEAGLSSKAVQKLKESIAEENTEESPRS